MFVPVKGLANHITRTNRTMKTAILVLILLLAVVPISPSQSPLSTSSHFIPRLRDELGTLVQQGCSYRFINESTVEILERLSGARFVRNLSEVDESQIRLWAAHRNVPIIEIDPNEIDTSRFLGWYRFFAQVPVSSGFGYSMVVANLDGDENPEFYGTFQNFTPAFSARVFDIDSAGISHELLTYLPYPGVSRLLTDADRDGLMEVLFTYSAKASNYEQPIENGIPTLLQSVHLCQTSLLSPGFTGIYSGQMDADSAMDLLYKGSETDSTGDPRNGIAKEYIAEWNPDSTNFVRKWSIQLNPELQSGVEGFSVGDFDGDGHKEFAATDLFSSKVFVVENKGDDDYAVSWEDSTGLPNLCRNTTGDVDHDGRPEFFVGATTSTGNWTIMYEADHDNNFSPKVMFHLLSAGTFDSPIYLTADMDGIPGPELLILSGSDLYIFKGENDNNYGLWYFQRFSHRTAMTVFDLNDDGLNDLVINKEEYDSLSRYRLYTDLYIASRSVSVKDSTPHSSPGPLRFDVFPNPSNSSFVVVAPAPIAGQIALEIFTTTGQLVYSDAIEGARLFPTGVRLAIPQLASGVYLIRLKAGSNASARKLLLLR